MGSYPHPWVEGTVCVYVCVLPQNCCLNSIISKSKQAAAPKLDSLIQKVALYKVGKLFQAKAARVASKFENKKTNRTDLTRKAFESN